MLQIDIKDLQNDVNLDRKKVKHWAESILKAIGEDDVELSLLFVNDACIRRLNRKYRRVDSKTDVLAFSMRDGGSVRERVLGDVVISAETAKKEAKKRKVPVQKEIYLYLAHGILHLLGYDDTRPSNRKKMRAKEKELLNSSNW